MDLELLETTLADAGRARLPRAPGLGVGRARRRRLRGDDQPAGGAARAARRARAALDARARAARRTSRDGTVKALFHTADGRADRGGADALPRRPPLGLRLLAVGLPADLHLLRHRQMKFGRNLTAREILDQALHFRRIEAIDHVVFMGMGEPMMNLDNVLAACERLPDLGITHRRTAISTVGWVPGHRPPRRVRDADPPGALAARARGRAALADHAGQRPLPARRGARRLRALLRAPPPQGLRRVRDARAASTTATRRRRSSPSCSTRASTRST